MLRRVLNVSLILWLIVAVAKPLFLQQQWTECHKISEVAHGSFQFIGVRVWLVVVLVWGEIMCSGGGGGKH